MYFTPTLLGVNTIGVLYVLHAPLNFTPSHIGYLFAEVNAVRFIGACLVSVVLVSRFHMSDYLVVVMTSVAYVGLTLTLSVTSTSVHVFLAPLWCIGVSSGIASTRSAMSKMVSSCEHGKLFSVVACLEVVTVFAAMTLLNLVYRITVYITPGFTFRVMACVSLIPLLLGLALWRFAPKLPLCEKDSSVTIDTKVDHKRNATGNDDSAFRHV